MKGKGVNMKTYLITGGAGFIGSNFIHYLYEKYGEVIRIINLDSLTYASNISYLKEFEGLSNYYFIRGDICDTSLVTSIFKEYDINYVVHFAAETHVDNSIDDGLVFMNTNVIGTYNLLNITKQFYEKDNHIFEKFIYISTDEVYGELGEVGYFTENTPLNPRNPYSASKASGEFAGKAFFDTYGFPIIRTRCTNNYGPNQNEEKLIVKCIINLINGIKTPVYGDGLAVRDWIYVKDHCRAIDLIIDKGTIGEVYNIGCNNEKNTIEIVNSIVDIMNRDYNYNIKQDYFIFVKDRLGHDRRYALDANKIKEELGFHPLYQFNDGLKETIDWYMTRRKADRN